jgi:isopropylmalate/homocitrate/citramalate synthase
MTVGKFGGIEVNRSLVWTGDLNESALSSTPASASSDVKFYDTTLRDGEQSVGVVISPEQKLQIAKLIDSLGVQRIEAGFPRVSEDDRRAIEMIRDADLRADIWGFSRAMPADIRAIADLGLKYTVIEAPISDMKLQALGVDRSEMVRRIQTTIDFAVKAGIQVAYFGVDGTRANMQFFSEVYRAALEAGASELVVVDTLGIATPEAVAYLVGKVVALGGKDVPVHYHGHNDFGLATAGAVAAVRAGAKWIHGTINGMGERAGNTSIPEAALALGALYGVETGVRYEKTYEVSREIQKICGYTLEPWKPLIGQNLFRRETGTVASQFHHPPAIEPYASQLVGQSRSIVLGKKSGLDSIRIKCRDLGVTVADERLQSILDAVKARGVEKRGLVSEQEFLDIVTQIEVAAD